MTTRGKAFTIYGLRKIRKFQREADNPILSILHLEYKYGGSTDDEDESLSSQPETHLVTDQLDEPSIAENMDIGENLVTEDLLQSEEDEMSLERIEEQPFLGAADMNRSMAFKIIFKMSYRGFVSPFRLRGDTVGYLAEMLLGYMTDKLEKAILMAISREYNTDTYPEVTKEDIVVLDRIHLRLPFTSNGSRVPRCCVGMEEHGDICHGTFSSCFLSSSSGIIWCWLESRR